MRVCFYGNTGHALTAIAAKQKLPQVDYILVTVTQVKHGKIKSSASNAGYNLKECLMLMMLKIEKPDILIVDNRFTEQLSC